MNSTPKRKGMLWLAPPLAAVLMLLFIVTHSSYSQTVATTAQTVVGNLGTIDPMTLFSANDPVMTDPGGTDPSTTDSDPPPRHLSNGSKWALFGTAKDDLDPLNPFNQVISFDTNDPNAIAGAVRRFGPHTKVGMLTDQVELKYYYVGRTCGAGSTRIQLGIDGDGDGKFNQNAGGPDQNAFGYIGDKPFGGGCLTNQWVYEDMTDNAAKWDLSQWFTQGASCDMTCTWPQVVNFFNTVFPNHQVLNAVLVDDSGSFSVTDRGCAFFDQVSAGKDTLDEWDDTTGGGKQPNNCSPN